jgi:hypothetical protein
MTPYLHHCSGAKKILHGAIWDKLRYIYCKYIIIIKRIYAGNTPSKDAIWNEFGEQQGHKAS